MKVAFINRDGFDGLDKSEVYLAIANLVDRIRHEFPARPILVAHGCEVASWIASRGLTTDGPGVDWSITYDLKMVEPPDDWFDECWEGIVDIYRECLVELPADQQPEDFDGPELDHRIDAYFEDENYGWRRQDTGDIVGPLESYKDEIPDGVPMDFEAASDMEGWFTFPADFEGPTKVWRIRQIDVVRLEQET